MKSKKIMFGICPNCGKEIVRNPPISVGACQCHNPPIMVDLEPRFQVRLRNVPEPLYSKVLKVAKERKCSKSEALNHILQKKITTTLNSELRTEIREKLSV